MKRKPTVLTDGDYRLSLELSDEIGPTSGRFMSPYDNEPGRILINPDQPRVDMEIAVLHELNEYIKWKADMKYWTHKALEQHAEILARLLRNSPKLAQFFCPTCKKRG